MIKKYYKMIAIIGIMLSLTACTIKYSESIANEPLNIDYLEGYFTIIYQWNSYNKIVYANDTKVKYLVIEKSSSIAITPLYNADGSLQIYEEGK